MYVTKSMSERREAASERRACWAVELGAEVAREVVRLIGRPVPMGRYFEYADGGAGVGGICW